MLALVKEKIKLLKELPDWISYFFTDDYPFDPEAVKSGDVEMLQDLVTAAINGASRKVDEAMQSTMGGMLGGLGIPGL